MKTENILIADDSQDSLNIISTALNTLKYYNIFRAEDGESALKIYESKKIDISFIDLDMPPPDGMATLKRIKEINADAFVIIVTGSADVDNVQGAIKSGATGYIVKPYTQLRISEIMEKYHSRAVA